MKEVKMLKYYEIKEKKKDMSHTQSVISWVFKNLKFILIPGSKLKYLTIKEKKYERNISKRKILTRFRAPITIFGIILIFGIISIAVFQSWISPYTFREATNPFMENFSPPSPQHLKCIRRSAQKGCSVIQDHLYRHFFQHFSEPSFCFKRFQKQALLQYGQNLGRYPSA